MKKAISLLIIIALAASLVGCMESEDYAEKKYEEAYREGYNDACNRQVESIDGYSQNCEEAMYWIEQYSSTGNWEYLEEAYNILYLADQWRDLYRDREGMYDYH